MYPSRGNGSDAAGEPNDLNWGIFLDHCSIPQLPRIIVPPADDAPSAGEGTRVSSTGHNRADFTVHPRNCYRGVLIAELGPIAQLTGVIGTPADHPSCHDVRWHLLWISGIRDGVFKQGHHGSVPDLLRGQRAGVITARSDGFDLCEGGGGATPPSARQ